MFSKLDRNTGKELQKGRNKNMIKSMNPKNQGNKNTKKWRM